jgi:hypothetical protein
MAISLTPSYTDDASHVDGISIRQTETDGKVTEDEPGASLAASQRVQVVMTQGESKYLLDTAQSNALAAFMRKHGRKTGKQGRKAA